MKAITKLIFVLLMAAVATQAVAAPQKEYSEKELYMAQFVKAFKQAYTLPMTAYDGVVLTDLSCKGAGIYFHFNITKPELYDTYSNEWRFPVTIRQFLAQLVSVDDRFNLHKNRVYMGIKTFDAKGKKLLVTSGAIYSGMLLRATAPNEPLNEEELAKRKIEVTEQAAEILRGFLPYSIDQYSKIESITTKGPEITCHIKSSIPVYNIDFEELTRIDRDYIYVWLTEVYTDESLTLMSYYGVHFKWVLEDFLGDAVASAQPINLLVGPATKAEYLGYTYMCYASYFETKSGIKNLKIQGNKLTGEYIIPNDYKDASTAALTKKLIESFNFACYERCFDIFTFASVGGEIEFKLLNSKKKPTGITIHLTPQEILQYPSE